MTLWELSEEIAADIDTRLAEYLQEREAELRERVKAGVKIARAFGGYEITIAGHTITAEHDSSAHRWKFIVQEGIYEEFFSISEKIERIRIEIIPNAAGFSAVCAINTPAEQIMTQGSFPSLEMAMLWVEKQLGLQR